MQAGNQVGTSFWEMLLAEHGLDEEGVSVLIEIAVSAFTETEARQFYKGNDPLQLPKVRDALSWYIICT